MKNKCLKLHTKLTNCIKSKLLKIHVKLLYIVRTSENVQTMKPMLSYRGFLLETKSYNFIVVLEKLTEESTCHKMVIWLLKRFSCMKYSFLHFFISFKHDFTLTLKV